MLKDELYLPDYIFNSILDVTPEFLAEHGSKGLLCDTDNTLAYDNRKDIIPEAAEWIKQMREAGIKIAIMSNAFLIIVIPFFLFLIILERNRTKLPRLYKRVHNKRFIFFFLFLVAAWWIGRNLSEQL